MFTTLLQLIKKHGVKLFVGVVPALLAILQPGNAFNTASAQALVAFGGVLVAGLMYIVETLVKNLKDYGLSKTALMTTFDEDGEWLKSHATVLRQAYTDAKGALEQIPGVPAGLADLTKKYDNVQAALEDKFANVMTEIVKVKSIVPEVNDAAVQAHVIAFLEDFFKSKTAPSLPSSPPSPPVTGSSHTAPWAHPDTSGR